MTDELALEPMEQTERPARESGVSVSGGPLSESMGLGVGAHEGADRTSKELMTWNPVIRSPDNEINREKQILDARSRDIVRNSGPMQGAAAVHRDSIVGSHFRLNSRPNYKVLGLDDVWAEEFQQEVEAKFTLFAESDSCWVDASGMNTLTGLIRMGVTQFFTQGEVLATMEWLRESIRPYGTAMQMVDPDRLCNPDGTADTETLRRGVVKNLRGAPLGYWFRSGYANDPSMLAKANTWKYVPIRKPWGRLMVLHIIEQMRPQQTRGVAEMVAVLKEMRMTKRFHDISLQNAVINATFAAAIESELPPEQAFEQVGIAEDGSPITGSMALLQQIAQYQGSGRNMHIDGAKIPHLYPGTKLKVTPAGKVSNVGEAFEASLLRNVAAGLGLSYEELSRDFSQTNYSSARATMNQTFRYMQSRKKGVADRQGSGFFGCWLEESINKGDITSMPRNAPSFYEGLNKEAYTNCTWIGASRGQVEEYKETQALGMRLDIGVSTLEDECARLGKDWREVLQQKAREQAYAEELGLNLGAVAQAKALAEVSAETDDNNDDANDEKAAKNKGKK
jgi:lambda family phage portal protein